MKCQATFLGQILQPALLERKTVSACMHCPLPCVLPSLILTPVLALTPTLTLTLTLPQFLALAALLLADYQC